MCHGSIWLTDFFVFFLSIFDGDSLYVLKDEKNK